MPEPYLLTAEDAHVLFNYHKHTGLLTWKTTRSRLAHAGDEAGFMGPTGTVLIGIRGRNYTAARVIWLWVTGEWPQSRVRFRDGDPGNLRWANLIETRDTLAKSRTAVYQRRYRKLRTLAMNRILKDPNEAATYQALYPADARRMVKRTMDLIADQMLSHDLDPAER